MKNKIKSISNGQNSCKYVQRILFLNHLEAVATSNLITPESLAVASFILQYNWDPTVKVRRLTRMIHHYHPKLRPHSGFIRCPSEEIQFRTTCGIWLPCLCNLLCLEQFLSLSLT